MMLCMSRHMLLIVLTAVATGCGTSANVDSPAAPTTSVATTGQPIVTLVESSGHLTITPGHAGQSVTIPEGGAVSQIRFNWFTYKSGADQAARNQSPTAFGELYILTQEFLGIPPDLSSSTPGFVARAERIESDEYVFASTVTLEAGRQYFFYTNGKGNHVYTFDVDAYPGGDKYGTNYGGLVTGGYVKSGASWRAVPGGGYIIPPAGTFTDADFRLRGSR
jgi:hypothetical protein